MRWFRSKVGTIAWLAFFALACQLLLTFGHIHYGKAHNATAWDALTASGKAADHGRPGTLPDPVDSADDFCGICANISLAGTLAVPILLALLLPTSFIPEFSWPEAEIKSASICHLPFSARGPPSA